MHQGANLSPILYTGKEPDWTIDITNDVENYPGYPDGIIGPQMMEDFKNQALKFGTDIRYEMISKGRFFQVVYIKYTQRQTMRSTPTVLSSLQAQVLNGWD